MIKTHAHTNKELYDPRIVKQGDINYCVYVDTDSNYFKSKGILEYKVPNFNELESFKKDEYLEKVALTYQDLITQYYDEFSSKCMNVKNHRLDMKTECVIRSAYFRAPRRYAQFITKQEGIVKETLDVKGLEYKKSNFPKLFGNFFKQVVEDVLKGSKQKEIDQRILDFKSKILKSNIR